jgi:hypothetical protein
MLRAHKTRSVPQVLARPLDANLGTAGHDPVQIFLKPEI